MSPAHSEIWFYSQIEHRFKSFFVLVTLRGIAGQSCGPWFMLQTESALEAAPPAASAPILFKLTIPQDHPVLSLDLSSRPSTPQFWSWRASLSTASNRQLLLWPSREEGRIHSQVQDSVCSAADLYTLKNECWLWPSDSRSNDISYSLFLFLSPLSLFPIMSQILLC